MRLEEVPFDGGVFKCPVRPLGLSIGPWVGKPMVDVQLCAGVFERMRTERLLAFHRMIRVHDQLRDQTSSLQASDRSTYCAQGTTSECERYAEHAQSNARNLNLCDNVTKYI